MQSRDEVNKRLLDAAQMGYSKSVQRALDAGADVNYSDGEGNTNNKKINLKIKQDGLLAQEKTFRDIKQFLEGKPVGIDSLVGGAWLRSWESTRIDQLREFLSTLTPAEREKLKKDVYQAIIIIAKQNPLLPRYIELMQRMRLAYISGCKAPLFELLRMGDHEKVDHDVGTWKDFCALMDKGGPMQQLHALSVFNASRRSDAIAQEIENCASSKAEQFNRGPGNMEL